LEKLKHEHGALRNQFKAQDGTQQDAAAQLNASIQERKALEKSVLDLSIKVSPLLPLSYPPLPFLCIPLPLAFWKPLPSSAVHTGRKALAQYMLYISPGYYLSLCFFLHSGCTYPSTALHHITLSMFLTLTYYFSQLEREKAKTMELAELERQRDALRKENQEARDHTATLTAERRVLRTHNERLTKQYVTLPLTYPNHE
jgi:hypothetical protein